MHTLKGMDIAFIFNILRLLLLVGDQFPTMLVDIKYMGALALCSGERI